MLALHNCDEVTWNHEWLVDTALLQLTLSTVAGPPVDADVCEQYCRSHDTVFCITTYHIGSWMMVTLSGKLPSHALFETVPSTASNGTILSMLSSIESVICASLY